MKKEEIVKKLNLMICNDILHYYTEISPTEFYLENFVIDSLGFLNFLCRVEKEFEVEIEDNKWRYNSFDTLKSLSEYIYEKRIKDVV